MSVFRGNTKIILSLTSYFQALEGDSTTSSALFSKSASHPGLDPGAYFVALEAEASSA